jgi:hypothetical protein
MPTDAHGALRAELGAEPPPGLVKALGPDELEALAGTVRAAKERQRRALERAGDDALRHLPGIVRKGVLRVLR